MTDRSKQNHQDVSVDWIDRLTPEWQMYGHPGKVTVTKEWVSYGPDVVNESRALSFIKYFSWFFIPAFSLTTFFLIPGPEKWVFVVAGPMIVTVVLTTLYYAIRDNLDAGPYLKFDRVSGDIVLPRYDLRFEIDRVSLQLISGCSSNGGDVQTDLNLIADVEGERHRYFIDGSPNRKVVRQFVEHAAIDVNDLNMGRGYRDIDARSK